MGFFDTKTKKIKFQPIPLSGSQQVSDQFLQDLVQKNLQFQPQGTAPLAPGQQAAIGAGTQVAQGGIPGMNDAVSAIRDIMTGDVSQVPGLAGLFAKVKELGSNLVGSTRTGLSMTGNLPSQSSRGERVMGRTVQDIMEGLVTSAFPFFQQGLQAKLNAPMNLANVAERATTTPINVGLMTGGVEQGQEQDILNRIFEAIRTTQGAPFNLQAPVAQNIMNQQRFIGQAQQPGASDASEVAGFMQMIMPLLTGMGGLGSVGGSAGDGGLGSRLGMTI